MEVSININKTVGVVAGTSIIAPPQTSGFTNIYSTDYDGGDTRISMGNPANLDFEKNEDYKDSFEEDEYYSSFQKMGRRK